MKKMKNFFALLLVTVMATVMLVGCGEPKATPEESAKIFLDVLLKDDKTNMEKIGMNEDTYTEFRKTLEDGIMEGFTSTGIDSSILTDEVKDSFKNNILTGLTKLEYEVLSSSTDQDTAKVEVKIKGFDMQKIVGDGQNEIMEKVTTNPSMSEAEIYEESFKIIGNAIAAGTVKKEPATITVVLTKENNVWLPEGNDIMSLMSSIVEM